MRKLKTKTSNAKKEKLKQLSVGTVLIAVMLFSVIGYSLQGNTEERIEKVNYNGFEFISNNGYWNLELNGANLVFLNNPKQIETSKLELNSITSYYSKPLYIYSEYEPAKQEILKNLYPFVQRYQEACIKNEVCDKDFPIKTCEDNLIIIKESSENQIYQEQNCVFILGDQENFIKLSDSALFEILQITQ